MSRLILTSNVNICLATDIEIYVSGFHRNIHYESVLSRPFQLDMLFEDLRARCIDITDKNMPTLFHVPTKISISVGN